MDLLDLRIDLNILDYNNNDVCDEDCCDLVYFKKEYCICCILCSIYLLVDLFLIYSENLMFLVFKMYIEIKNNYSLDDVFDEFDLYDGFLLIKVINFYGDLLK